MDRRAFLVALVAAYGCGQKEQPKKTVEAPARIPRIAMLYFSSTPFLGKAFRQRLSELGYVEGKTIVIEERFADGNAQRLAELARELAASKVDIIVATGSATAVAARQATSTIPIVMVSAANAASVVSAGLIASLAQPGGNVTGTTDATLQGKLVDLLHELVPKLTKIAILANPTNIATRGDIAAATGAATKFNIGVVVVEVARAEEFPNAFAAIRNAHPDGLIVSVDPLIGDNGTQVIDFAAGARLPAIYDWGGMAKQGGLMAYTSKSIDYSGITAEYVDKILKGAKPAELAVQQPALFELVINLKTAKALGLAIPRDLLLRADEVIQ